jgi:hypothetical protein
MTAKGFATLPVAIRAIQEVEAWWSEILGETQFAQLRRLLIRLDEGVRTRGGPRDPHPGEVLRPAVASAGRAWLQPTLTLTRSAAPAIRSPTRA